MACLFCGGDASEPDHWLHCDGRQGAIEIAAHTQVRTSDPDTSHQAAWSLANASDVQRRVHGILDEAGRRGVDDDALLRTYRAQWLAAESSPRKRRNDLVRAGIVIDSGERRLVGKRWRIVWILKKYLTDKE